MNWRILHQESTVSTNLDAKSGRPGDVFTADFQTGGRGRLDHKWLSPPGTNLLMSVVLGVDGLTPERISTLPLVVGLSVLKAIKSFGPSAAVQLKWPNDVLIGGRKVSGILCERNADAVIVGIGVNVGKQQFAPEIAARATTLAKELASSATELTSSLTVDEVRDRILHELSSAWEAFSQRGFAAFHAELSAVDFLKGRQLAVVQTDDDHAPISGLCRGILEDGSLAVGSERIYAGEAHVVL